MELLDMYGRASEWTLTKVAGAADKLDAPSTCDGWDVRTLMNHMLDTHRYFVSTAKGEEGARPSAEPPESLSDDPVADFSQGRSDALAAFGRDGVIEKTGPILGIAFTEQLVHGWDLATATGQDATMPDGLPEAAYQAIHGRFTDEQRKGTFGPELPVPDDASAQDRLLAYTGRDPSAT